MKIVFVVGGSYKRFYFNELKNLHNVDLLMFGQDIFYDYDINSEGIDGNGIVGRELIELNQKLNCPIVVSGNVIKNGVRVKCLILCINGRVSLIEYNKDIYLDVNGKLVLISSKFYKYSRADIVICLKGNSMIHQINGINYPNNCFLMDKKGVILLKSGKIYRKFKKCCNFILRF